jgi:enoyl-CoA hydratase
MMTDSARSCEAPVVTDLVTTSTVDGVFTITMDDGKANALSPAMFAALNEALDGADKSGANGVVVAGRPGRFSGGFDLNVLRAGGPAAEGMLRSGFELAERLLGFARPVVMACTGHAVAMGAFVLASGDYRVGAAGDFKLQANEVAIGLTMPYPAVAILRHRLTPSAFDRAINLSELFTPATAVADGWLDLVVEPEAVVDTAQRIAASFAALDPTAHANSKRRARAGLLAELRRGIESEFGG